MLRVFRNIRTGTKMIGEIIGIKSPENRIYVIRLKNEQFTAYSEIDFQIGNRVLLEVIEAGEQPHLKLSRAEVEKSVPTEAENLLRICKLEINTKNVELMCKYLSSGSPVQLDKILHYFKEMKNSKFKK